ncbi:YjfK family protein [Xanthomonas campestris]|nr:YjfK family protein [Xanthomonas campestris]MCC4605914.1 YjfK family protein [Xanthomonas campestris pv. parthenii]
MTMSFFSKLFGQPQPPPLPGSGTGAIGHALPLGLRVGGQVAIDTTLYRMAPDAMTAELPGGNQGIPCYGHVNLGDGYALHRFYLDDDAFLQVTTVGGDLEAMKAFVYCETVNPPSKQAFQDFVMQHPHLGAAQIDYAGKRWQRATQSTDDSARIPPIAYDEVLYRYQPPRRDGDLTHYAMLYSRDVPELQREEFLLVTGEDSGPNEFCVTYAVGIDVTVADLDIT